MRIIVAQDRNGTIHIADRDTNLPAPRDLIRYKEFFINDIGVPRKLNVNLEKWKLQFDSENT